MVLPCTVLEQSVSDDMYNRNTNWNTVPSDDLIKPAKENDARDHIGDDAKSTSLRREDVTRMTDLFEMIVRGGGHTDECPETMKVSLQFSTMGGCLTTSRIFGADESTAIKSIGAHWWKKRRL